MELEFQEVCTEVDTIIKYMPDEYRRKIPDNVMDFFEKQRIENYEVNIDKNDLFGKSILKEETLDVIAMLNIKYWCPNERIKKQLIEKYSENEKLYQKELEEKYNPDNIFKDKLKEIGNEEATANNMQLVKYKEGFFAKLINRIKKFFHK